MTAGLHTWLERARAFGFLGPGPLDVHLAHAAGFADAVPQVPRRFVDLGSGGGVPGLVLAVRWPGVAGVLLDASERRTAFLQEAVDDLGLAGRLTVVRARAEAFGRDLAARHQFDLAVARGFGPPAVTAECAAPLLAVGGRLVVSEPPEDRRRWPAAGLAALGLVIDEFREGVFRYACLRQERLAAERYPRRVGVPAKRPLF